jgi:BirA family biotin operon repressor/biotin-[acetyl-CoA-carboxylase] ligase
MLTIVMALALAEGISDLCDVQAGIKWPNDIVINKHKICGILTEMHLNGDGSIADVVIGDGINVNTESFPENIRDMAGSLLTETGKKTDRNLLVAAVMRHFEEDYDAFCEAVSLAPLKDAYEKKLLNRGNIVRVLDPAGEYTGTAQGITETGELIVERDGREIFVNAGEVSVRGLYGYV